MNQAEFDEMCSDIKTWITKNDDFVITIINQKRGGITYRYKKISGVQGKLLLGVINRGEL